VAEREAKEKDSKYLPIRRSTGARTAFTHEERAIIRETLPQPGNEETARISTTAIRAVARTNESLREVVDAAAERFGSDLVALQKMAES